ncbi:sporulation integral membrane protein YtvI [Tepidibacillus sp. LV47]|uniref:sporulation integral membrane protein YtvI n=1 Tax=Tepidibacillus sp. LV47 TaxID=3398228 RepID=UPI003AABEE17
MFTFYKKYAKTVFDIFLLILTVYLIMLVFSYVYNIAKPIFIGFVIYLLIEPLARFLHKRGIKKSMATTISTLVFILIILGIVVTFGIIFTLQIQQLAESLPRYIYFFQEELMAKAHDIQGKLSALPPNVVEKVRDYSQIIADKSSAFLSGVLLGIFHFLTSIPTLVVNFVLGLILAYFLSLEIVMWKRLAEEKTPKTFKRAFYFLKEHVIKGILTYIKAQLKLISFTFIMIFIGLLLLGIENSFSISLLAAFFDMLPILGISTVFIPWIIYLIIIGNTVRAFWLGLLLLVVIVFRQIAEPKITGESLGVSAFTMLSFMVISLSLFGVAGVILSPVLVILIKALYEKGYLKKWIRIPEDEYIE